MKILHALYIGDDARALASLEEMRVEMDVSQIIYDCREDAGLTQRQLAKRAGTTQSVISRLESADYAGHSLQMLARIAHALKRRVHIAFVEAASP